MTVALFKGRVACLSFLPPNHPTPLATRSHAHCSSLRRIFHTQKIWILMNRSHLRQSRLSFTTRLWLNVFARALLFEICTVACCMRACAPDFSSVVKLNREKASIDHFPLCVISACCCWQRELETPAQTRTDICTCTFLHAAVLFPLFAHLDNREKVVFYLFCRNINIIAWNTVRKQPTRGWIVCQ